MSVESALKKIKLLSDHADMEEVKDAIIDLVAALAKDDDFRRRLAATLGIATKEDIERILVELKEIRREYNERFEQIRREYNERFERVYREMKEMRKEYNERFERVQTEIKQLKDEIAHLVKEISRLSYIVKQQGVALRVQVESVVDEVMRFAFEIMGKDIHTNLKIVDINGVAFPKGTEVEINAVSFKEPMVFEYTSHLKKDDVERIEKKEKLIRALYNVGPMKKVIACMTADKEAEEYANKKGIRLIKGKRLRVYSHVSSIP